MISAARHARLNKDLDALSAVIWLGFVTAVCAGLVALIGTSTLLSKERAGAASRDRVKHKHRGRSTEKAPPRPRTNRRNKMSSSSKLQHASISFTRKTYEESSRPASARPEASSPSVIAGSDSQPAGSIHEIIHSAAAEFGVDHGYLTSIADCESDFNPRAVNSYGYYGLFQFHPETWAAHGYGSIYDPIAQARTAAKLIAAGHSSMWPNCA